MSSYVLTKAAENDMEQIYSFTCRKWSQKQSDIYTFQLYRMFEVLSDLPGIGVKRTEFYKDCRRFQMGRHYIYYIETSDSIKIGRIIHVQQNQSIQGSGFNDQEQAAYEAA